jgi:hypothetical protein
MSNHTDIVGLLKYAMDAGTKAKQTPRLTKKAAVTLSSQIVMRQKVAMLAKKSGFSAAFASPTLSGFLHEAVKGTPGWAKALGLVGAGVAGVAGARELMKRYDPGVDPEAKGIGMNRNLRNALTEQTAKATSWASELGGMQHAMRNAYAPLYN